MAGRVHALQANTSHEHGVEQIATVSIPAGTPAGTIILQTPIAAPTIGVRLATFSQLWTKTTFRDFVVEVTSSNPSTVSGNYTIAIDPDPAQTYSSDANLPARLMALTMATRSNAWADATVRMQPNALQLFNRFHTEGASDAEIREYAAGQLIMATSTDYTDDCEYTVNVGWDVVFEKPDTTGLEDNAGPGFVLMNTEGLPYFSNDLVNLVVGGADAAFNRPNIGSFDRELDDTLTVSVMLTNGSHRATYVSSLAYDAPTRTLTIGLTGAVDELASGVLGLQNPKPYQLNIGDAVPPTTLRKIGYGYIHPVFLRRERKELEWYNKALKKHEDKLSLDAVRRSLRNAKLRAYEQMDEQALKEEFQRLSLVEY
jgi:hypothetical protein